MLAVDQPVDAVRRLAAGEQQRIAALAHQRIGAEHGLELQRAVAERPPRHAHQHAADANDLVVAARARPVIVDEVEHAVRHQHPVARSCSSAPCARMCRAARRCRRTRAASGRGRARRSWASRGHACPSPSLACRLAFANGPPSGRGGFGRRRICVLAPCWSWAASAGVVPSGSAAACRWGGFAVGLTWLRRPSWRRVFLGPASRALDLHARAYAGAAPMRARRARQAQGRSPCGEKLESQDISG